MADLLVHPSIVVGPEDIITADILNLLATPVVDLALAEPVNDQNFCRNGNYYSSFWVNATGISCPVNVETSNANYWYTKPTGAAVTTKRSTSVPDTNSLFSLEIDGAINVTDVEFGQHINGDLSATLRRICTFSGNIYNNSGIVLSPKLRIYSANAFNNFNTVTLQKTVDLQTCSNAIWTFVSATLDLSLLSNIANGISVVVLIPSGTLSAGGKSVNFSRLKFQIGEIATEFTDDVSLFVTSPSVDSTMLQDGCIARPSLFLPNVVPTGAYQAKSIQDGDIADNTITARALAAGAVTGSLGYTPINKAGDTGVGKVVWDVDTVSAAVSGTTAGVVIETTTTNAANDGYIPAIGFNRPGGQTRSIGLAVDGRLRTIDGAGTVGYLLDSVHGVDTNSYQDASVTYPKLAASTIAQISPIGMVTMFAGPSPPAGWFICDGHQVSRTTYSALFAVIGTYWGAGDNVSTFNVPDLRGRAMIGYAPGGASGITARTFGSLGGEENHQLSVAELAAHNHGTTESPHSHPLHDPAHQHAYNNSQGASINLQGGTSPVSCLTFGILNTGLQITGISMDAVTTGLSINNNGSNVGHNNMQPFAVAYYIIRAT